MPPVLPLPPPVLLIADIHLSAAHPDRSRRFAEFLRGPAREAKALCILGDLFDEWIGDDDDSVLANQTRNELRDLNAAGVRVVLMRGNRDFLLGPRFARESGCEVATADAIVAEVGGTKFLLAHGDHLVADESYLRYRRRIRGGLFSAFAHVLPKTIRRNLASQMRSASRGNVAEAKLDMARVQSELRDSECKTLIHGHLHTPSDESRKSPDSDGNPFRRISLPDWTDSPGGFAKISPDGICALQFPPS